MSLVDFPLIRFLFGVYSIVLAPRLSTFELEVILFLLGKRGVAIIEKLAKEHPPHFKDWRNPRVFQEGRLSIRFFAIGSLAVVVERITAILDALRLRFIRIVEGRASQPPRPLVSVCMPTYNRGRLLVQRSLPSLLKQTYENFEVVIVGDHCTDDTEVLLSKVRDKRIRFVNLPSKGQYPKEFRAHWQVAGVTPLNKAIELARGDWIAIMADDDEYTEDHIEVLLTECRRRDLELVYGAVLKRTLQGWDMLGSHPPRQGQILTVGALYKASLKFIKWNTDSWKVDEPADWNLIRRMILAGAKMGFVNKVVARHDIEAPEKRQVSSSTMLPTF